jgi:hypothetical protein
MIIGKEYVYLSQFVKLIAVECEQATIQTRFGEVTTVDVSELSEKEDRQLTPKQ